MGSPPPPYQYIAPSQKRAPPPLPPRASSAVDAGAGSGSGPSPGPGPGPVSGWLSADPRTSSTQSLVPSVPDSTAEAKRTLLIVWIHGFYGNDQSFRSFPAHVHTYLRGLLIDSHVIHSKIYPRYKTYKSIEIARDNFSAWLEPHEGPTTDVILVGHSMGGLLAAEIVLMPNQDPYRQRPFKHRILGTISLDSPFLGLHPGIIVSGLSSLVNPAPKSPTHEGQEPSSPSSPTDSRLSSIDLTPSIDSALTSPSLSSFGSGPPSRRNTDPHFDPPFFNDAPFREQPFLKRLVNFANKHKSEGIVKALRSHLLSHLEFGGCLADYPGLMNRYKRLRALEDVDELKAVTEGHPGGSFARVRFLNYYTLSSGRPKPPKVDTPKPDSPGADAPSHTDEASEKAQAELSVPGHAKSESGVSTPSISVEGYSDGEQRAATTAALDSKLQDVHLDQAGEARRSAELPSGLRPVSMQELEPMSMEELEPMPMPMDEEPEPPPAPLAPQDEPLPTTEKDPSIITTEQALPDAQSEAKLDLPPIPDAPAQPDLPDLTQYTDKDARKQAEKESKRLQKAYDQAVKDRAKALREREKLLEKRRKKAEKDADQARKNAQKEKQRLDREEDLDTLRIVRDAEDAAQKAETQAEAARDTVAEAKAEKPKKQRKFCTLPGKTNGARDTTWVDVYMEGMDEVGAHCGLFFPGPHYEPLVGDVGNRILRWVQDDLSTRTILEMGS